MVGGGAVTYLSDRDLRELLPKLDFKAADPAHPFDPAAQIQPCSIDLRLDNVFWVQRSGKNIDLRSSQLLEIEPRRHWRRERLSANQSTTLKPGEMLLGRTYEEFTVPVGFAGKLEGRSSFARMGLAIHCSADFINPGYRGHMPLQLINLGGSTITIVPYLPICQLIVVSLSSASERVYGDRELYSKYVDDDGGPSYWWRDKRIKALHAALGNHNVSEAIQREILELIRPCEPEVIERLEKFVAPLPIGDLTNSHDILERFAVAEDQMRRITVLRYKFSLWLGPVLATSSLGSLFRRPLTELHYALWAAAVAALIWAAWVYFKGDPPGDYLGKKELDQIMLAPNTGSPR